jgi:hypothetical protein
MAHLIMSQVQCRTCGDFQISEDVSREVSREDRYDAKALRRLSKALRLAFDRSSPAQLHYAQDVMRVMGDLDLAEHRRKLEGPAADALIGAGESSDAWHLPIHAVDRALGFETRESETLVRDMYRRKVVVIKAHGYNVADQSSARTAYWWEKGPTPPGEEPAPEQQGE